MADDAELEAIGALGALAGAAASGQHEVSDPLRWGGRVAWLVERPTMRAWQRPSLVYSTR